jgi:Leucine-rich repeat (LRR) protein
MSLPTTPNTAPLLGGPPGPRRTPWSGCPFSHRNASISVSDAQDDPASVPAPRPSWGLRLVALLCLPLLTTAAPRDDVSWIDQLGGRTERNEKGEIVVADFTGTWVSDADLPQLLTLPALRKLTLAETRITDMGLEHLRTLSGIRELDCRYTESLTEYGIAHLAGWQHLERLNLRGSQVTSRVFDHLARLTGLRWLDIGNTSVSDEGFEQLAALTRLEYLSIGGNRLTGEALPQLELLPALRRLDVSGIQRVDSGLWGLPLTDQNVDRIARLTRLESLDLSGATLADRGTDRPGHELAERKEMRQVARLAPLTNLERLDLSRLPVTTGDLAFLARFTRLRELRLGLAPNVDDGIVTVLAQLPALESLYLGGTGLTGAGLEALSALPGLKQLWLGGSQVSQAAVEAFRQKRPECRVHWWPANAAPAPTTGGS